VTLSWSVGNSEHQPLQRGMSFVNRHRSRRKRERRDPGSILVPCFKYARQVNFRGTERRKQTYFNAWEFSHLILRPSLRMKPGGSSLRATIRPTSQEVAGFRRRRCLLGQENNARVNDIPQRPFLAALAVEHGAQRRRRAGGGQGRAERPPRRGRLDGRRPATRIEGKGRETRGQEEVPGPARRCSDFRVDGRERARAPGQSAEREAGRPRRRRPPP
jgi:hypothetical protein